MIIALFSVLSFALWSHSNYHQSTIPPPSPQPQDKVVPTLEGTVTINGEKFAFDPSKVETVRPGSFSVRARYSKYILQILK